MLGPEEISSEETKVFRFFPFSMVLRSFVFFSNDFLIDFFSLSDSGESFVPNWLLISGTGA